MITLIIDTSTERALVALNQPNLLKISFKELPFGHMSSHHLMPAIEELLTQDMVKKEDITLIGVAVGPGSFTGIRVGVAVAKGASFALQKPLYGFCSLLGFIPHEEGSFAALIDAKMGGVYLLKGEKKGHNVVFEGVPELIDLQRAAQIMAPLDWWVSPTALRLQEKLGLKSNTQWVERAPDPFFLASLVQKNKEEAVCGAPLPLIYIR